MMATKKIQNRLRLLSAGVLISLNLGAQPHNRDTLSVLKMDPDKYGQFYDSLKARSGKNQVGRLLYRMLISEPKPPVDRKALSLENFNIFKGKIINSIDITPLNVFGPTLQDTARKAHTWIERTANSLHTKSNLQTIKKMLLFRAGSKLDPNLLYENERIIRALPWIRDVMFLPEADSIHSEFVRLHVITKDRFSFGASGELNGSQSGALEVYNQNLFGVGHEFALRFVGHLYEKPYLGYEAYYKVNNVNGRFIDITLGYSDIYNREGLRAIIDKQFLLPSSKWGYGAAFLRLFRAERIVDTDPVITDLPLDLISWSSWVGRSIQINQGKPDNSQLVFTCSVNHRRFFERPLPDPYNQQYFFNSTFYLGGVTFSQRKYVRDQLVYSYGITEDIPKGFKNELVYGYEKNEFGNRHYFHIALSDGSLMGDGPGYLYARGAFGGYLNKWRLEQGIIQADLSYISKLLPAGTNNTRFFAGATYTLGVRRFDVENLLLKRNNMVRGFSSSEPRGKQRLGINLEYVLFLKKELYRFSMALFSFADAGLIGSNKKLIFNESLYGGFGLGIRLHNEYLVFKTIQLRLAIYPNHPGDMAFMGFTLYEVGKRQFYNFQPGASQPLRFE